jgi:hypothetical protein
LATSYGLNGLGDMFGAVALAVLVFAETGSALATTALFLAAKAIPGLLAPALTAATDRLAVGRIVPLMYLVEAVCFAALALLADAFWLPAILALALIDGTLALTARGLTRGAVGTVLAPAGLLREGNGLLNVIYAATSAAGPVSAGLLIHVAGASTALWADAASFALAAVVLSRGARRLTATGGTHVRWVEQLRDGLSYVRGHRLAGRLIVGEGVAIVFFTMVVPISVVFVKESLGSTSVGYGVMLGAWGAGVIAGSAIFARARRRDMSTLIVWATVAVGAGYAGTAAAPELWVACAASVIGGVGNGVQWVAVMTALQESIDARYQARATGLLEAIGAIAPGVGFVCGGALTALSSPRAAYACAAVGALTVAGWWMWRPLRGPADNGAGEPSDRAAVRAVEPSG